VSVKIRYDDFTTINRSSTLGASTDVGRLIGSTAENLVRDALDAGRPVRLLGVGVSMLEHGESPQQLNVMDDPRRQELERSLDTIRERFGAAGVETGVLKYVKGVDPQKSGAPDH
jgi:DNA polymerase-4